MNKQAGFCFRVMYVLCEYSYFYVVMLSVVHCKKKIVYKLLFLCYLWEMVLDMSLDISFSNM